MAWTSNLQTEILEQFADPKWHNAVFDHIASDAGMTSTSEDANWKITARKRDDTFAQRVLDVAQSRFTWRCTDLARELGDDSRSGSCLVGKVLANTPGWDRCNYKTWANKAAVLAWCAEQTNVRLTAVSRHVKVSPHRLAEWLRDAGWTTARVRVCGRDTSVWNKAA